MGLFEMSPEQVAEGRRLLNDAVSPHLPAGEELVAAGMFRRGGAGARMAISKGGLGGIAYAGSALFSKKQAGGLPDKVILAVTPTKVHAFSWKIKGRTYKVKDEVAVWDRAGLKVSTERKKTLTMLTIESPAEGEKATLAPGGVGDDPLSGEVMDVLQGGAPAGPAA